MLEMPTGSYRRRSLWEHPVDRPAQAVFFIDGGALDESPDVASFFQQIEKANPRLEIKLVAVYNRADIKIRVAT